MMNEQALFFLVLIDIIFGTIIIMLISVIISLKTLRRKIVKQSKLIKQIVETNESLSLDLKLGTLPAQESTETTSVKNLLLKTLKRSCVFASVGIALLAVALYINSNNLIIIGGAMFGIGVALLITFFIFKKHLKTELEIEENQLQKMVNK